MDHQTENIKTLTLEIWLERLFNPVQENDFINSHFPTPKLREEYISSVSSRMENDVNELLRNLLIRSGSLGTDEINLSYLFWAEKNDLDLYMN